MDKLNNRYKIKPSLLEIAFAEIMPEVKFIDCTPIGRSVVSKKNFLKIRKIKND